jgi:ribosomal protein L13E
MRRKLSSRGTFTGYREKHGLSNGEAAQLSVATDARKKSVDCFANESWRDMAKELNESMATVEIRPKRGNAKT